MLFVLRFCFYLHSSAEASRRDVYLAAPTEWAVAGVLTRSSSTHGLIATQYEYYHVWTRGDTCYSSEVVVHFTLRMSAALCVLFTPRPV